MGNNVSSDILFRRIALKDDRDAFKELFFTFYPSVCVYAARYISSPETCEDIVQDTFYHLWKNRKNIELTNSFRNLLITSVKNNCIDYLRKQSVRQNYLQKQAIIDITNTPEIIYTINELENMIYTALSNLPEKVKKAFELSRFDNLTYNQIAKEMAVSPKTVEAYISKALNVLRIELKDYLPIFAFLHIFI